MKKHFVLSCVLLLLLSSLTRACLAASEGEASASLGESEGILRGCFEAVAEAEAAGANVSSLLIVLNEAGGLLDRGRLALAYGDFDGAVGFADACDARLGGFMDLASVLRDRASYERSCDFWVNTFGSVVGTVLVVVAGFAVWVYVKRRYYSGGSA